MLGREPCGSLAGDQWLPLLMVAQQPGKQAVPGLGGGGVHIQINPLKAVDDAGGAVGVLPRDGGTLVQMDVPMQHILRVIAVQQRGKRREPAVRQVGHVAVAVQRRVGD